jgi:hypothetical protein
LFGSTGFRFITKNDRDRAGHEFNFSLAMGPRPLQGDYAHPDFVFLPELNVIHTFHARKNCVCVPHSQSTIAYLGPCFLWSFRNIYIKAGVQWVLGQIQPCDAENVEIRALAGLTMFF